MARLISTSYKMVAMVSEYTPKRVVSLQPSATATIAAIGQLDRIVACTKYCAEICPDVSQSGAVIVEDSWTAQAAQIIPLKPDLVIASVPYQEKAVQEILKAGSRFLGLAPHTLADIYVDMATIAGMLGVAERGDELIAHMRQQIEVVRSRTDGGTRPRVFCEEWGRPLIASQPWVAELVEAAGGEFIGKPGSQISSEEVLAANPDVVVAAWCGAGDRVPLEKIVRVREWEKMHAVRCGRVYCVRDEFLNTPAHTLMDGLRALAAAIHPERFPAAHGLRCIRQEQAAGEPQHPYADYSEYGNG